jgi:hypothetical protein
LRNLGPVDPESDPSTLVPAVFDRALAGLAAVELRPELDREQLPAPRRLASYSYADSVAVLGPVDAAGEAEELGSGRFVLLYEPDGHPEWKGVFRCVTLIQVDLETEIAEDRLLPAVAWSWLTEAFELRQARYAALGGTVSQCASTRFGDLSRAEPSAEPTGPGLGQGPGGTAMSNAAPAGGGSAQTGSGGTGLRAANVQSGGSAGLHVPGMPSAGPQSSGLQPSGAGNDRPGDSAAGELTVMVEPIEHSLELRASWTPVLESGAGGRAPSPEDVYAAVQAHFQAWSDLLSAAAGLPPVLAAGVSSFPSGGPRR